MQPNQIAIGGVLAGWFIVAIALFRGWRPAHAAPVRSRNIGGLFGIALQGGGFGMAFGWRRAPLSTLFAGSLEVQWFVAGVSVTLALVSAAFLVAAVRTLGKQWSLLPRLIQEHNLIQNGPYSIVRHPIYTSMLGLLAATSFAFSTIGGVVLAVVLYGVGTVLRIRIEERLLRSIFGERYGAYAERVPAFLPFRWTRNVA